RRLGVDRTGHGRTRCRTTNVESTHGQLSARLADGLGGDHTHGFAAVDQRAATQIAAIAVRAQAMTRFASQRRAYLDLIDAYAVDVLDGVLVEQRAGRNGGFLSFRVDDV